jgi:hypothetical protein
VSNTQVAVLTDRLAYVAYRAGADAQSAKDLAVIDTSDPAQPSVVGTPTALPHDPIGLIGTRNTNGGGGSVTLLYKAGAELTDAGPCAGQSPCLEVQRATVATEGVPVLGAVSQIGKYVGSPAYGSFLGKGGGAPVDYLGLMPTPPNGYLQAYVPRTGLTVGTPINFSINDPFLQPIAFADCLGQALLIGTNTETAVNAVPITAAGSGDRGVMEHSGESVRFEPFTSTVLAPFTQGDGYALTAFKLTGTPAAPKLTLRQGSDWKPPVNVRPEIVATRTPIPFDCP